MTEKVNKKKFKCFSRIVFVLSEILNLLFLCVFVAIFKIFSHYHHNISIFSFFFFLWPASQPVDMSQIMASTSQMMLDPAQRQQLQALSQPVLSQQHVSLQQQALLASSQQQLLACPQFMPQQQELLLHQMLSQPSLQHQLQVQQNLQQMGISLQQVSVGKRVYFHQLQKARAGQDSTQSYDAFRSMLWPNMVGMDSTLWC